VKKSRTIGQWVEAQQASGRYVFTRKDVEEGLGNSRVAIQTALRRSKQKGQIASPYRGFYVVVPPEYRATGCPPASWFIDDLMKHLNLHYYVSILSAAALHGAGHQQPMVFQVITDRAIRPMKAGKVHIEGHTSRTAGEMPVMNIPTETGTMVVATPETTAYDVVRFFSSAGNWSNIATVLLELAEKIDGNRLVDNAPLVQLPDVQRLGYLLSIIGEERLAEPLAAWLAQRRTTVVFLRTDLPKGDVKIDPIWRLYPNEQLDIDL
jgi:predicted transcriptional regulator of viral defense system